MYFPTNSPDFMWQNYFSNLVRFHISAILYGSVYFTQHTSQKSRFFAKRWIIYYAIFEMRTNAKLLHFCKIIRKEHIVQLFKYIPLYVFRHPQFQRPNAMKKSRSIPTNNFTQLTLIFKSVQLLISTSCWQF